jgi:hypothetical protein
MNWQFLLLAGLSVSIGWGVRGQFGHEYGAALAGALGGMVVALLAGRPDWRRRISYFAALGAIGWAFGGGMSYMKTVAYSHSSDSATALYGFACLFVLGFIWAAPGGTGIALPAYLDSEELTKMFAPLCAVLVAWYLEDAARPLLAGMFRGPLREFAGAGFNSIVAIAAVLALTAVRRQTWGTGSSLIVYMALGWWAGHLLLIKLLHLDMNPPRGDSWAGCLGMVWGILLFCWRRRHAGIAFATLATGFLGGIGFALGAAVKITAMSGGLVTNWHSVMEQTQGLFHGLAIGITFALVARKSPKLQDPGPARRWTEVFCVTFVLCVLNYLNFRRAPAEWTKHIESLTPSLYGIPVTAYMLPWRGFIGWFEMIYLAIAAAVIVLLILHLRRPLPFIPRDWLGKGQLFYLVFLWSIVIINFADVLPRFSPIRLVTEWFITLNAVACTVLLIAGCFAQEGRAAMKAADTSYGRWIRNTMVLGLLGAVAVSFAGWGLKRAIYGDRPTGNIYQDQIRFGPNNTNTKR